MPSRAAPRLTSLRAVGPVLGALREAGASDAEIAAAIGSSKPIDEGHPGLSGDEVRALWAWAAERLNEPNLGVRLASSLVPGEFDLLSYLASSSATLGQALGRIARYLRLLTDAVRYELREDTSGLWLVLERPPGVTPIPHADEFALAARVVFMRHWVGDGFEPQEALFAHTPVPGRDEGALPGLFRCPVTFDAPLTALRLPAGAKETLMRETDPGLSQLLERYAEETLASLPSSDDLLGRARRVTIDLLEGGEATVATVASTLAMSERSLQRRLREEGTSFSELLRGVREELATRYLRGTELATAEIAYMLGYSEQAAFYRAFRRWTGSTPSAYRADSA